MPIRAPKDPKGPQMGIKGAQGEEMSFMFELCLDLTQSVLLLQKQK